MERLLIALTGCLLFALLSPAAATAKSTPAMTPLETVSVLTLDGRIVIEPDGHVSDVEIYTKLTPTLTAMVRRNVLTWRFKPLKSGGTALTLSSLLHMGLAAADEQGKYQVWVDSVTFPEVVGSPVQHIDGEAEPISAARTSLPSYPAELQSRGFMGTILLAIRVTPDGKAGDVTAIQSMYYRFNQPKWPGPRALEVMEKSAVDAARHWTFVVPQGVPRAPERMTVTVPVHYVIDVDPHTPGVWVTVRRTPQRPIGWLPPATVTNRFGIANASGSAVSQYGAGPTLLNDPALVPLL